MIGAVGPLPLEPERVHYVVSLSSGISSAIAAERVMQRYSKQNVTLVFMDVLWEDDDNYRFLRELEVYWEKPIVRITEGRNPLQVSEDEHIIPNQRIAPCTKRLKIIPFVRYLAGMRDSYDRVVVVLGMNWSEPHRMESPRKNYGKLGFSVIYPLAWKPYDYHPMQTIRGWGIEPPRMYKMGYTHANCGGRCVKQGQGDWLRTRTNFPQRFDEVAEWESRMRQNPKHADYAILRDARKDTDSNVISLYDFIARHAQESPQGSGQMELPLGDESACFCNAGDPGDIALCDI